MAANKTLSRLSLENEGTRILQFLRIRSIAATAIIHLAPLDIDVLIYTSFIILLTNYDFLDH